MDAQQSHCPSKLAHEIDSWDLAVAAIDRAALVVGYCDGIGCNATSKGALGMSRLGFRAKELIGWLDWWRRDGRPTSQGEAAPIAGECSCN